jgi:hypothetical protein
MLENLRRTVPESARRLSVGGLLFAAAKPLSAESAKNERNAANGRSENLDTLSDYPTHTRTFYNHPAVKNPGRTYGKAKGIVVYCVGVANRENESGK